MVTASGHKESAWDGILCQLPGGSQSRGVEFPYTPDHHGERTLAQIPPEINCTWPSSVNLRYWCKRLLIIDAVCLCVPLTWLPTSLEFFTLLAFLTIDWCMLSLIHPEFPPNFRNLVRFNTRKSFPPLSRWAKVLIELADNLMYHSQTTLPKHVANILHMRGSEAPLCATFL